MTEKEKIEQTKRFFNMVLKYDPLTIQSLNKANNEYKEHLDFMYEFIGSNFRAEKLLQGAIDQNNQIIKDIKDRKEKLYQAIEQLEPLYRLIITDHHIKNKSWFEIANKVCYSVNHTRTRLWRRALLSLYELLPSYCLK